MSKKRKPIPTKRLRSSSYVLLIFRVLVVYVFALVMLVVLTAHFNIPLYAGSGEDRFPSAWLWLLMFSYYAMPVILAALFAWNFRPFWRNFRNLLVTILVVQLVYSLFAFAVRYQYLEKWKQGIHESRISRLDVNWFKHRFFDTDKDGLIDLVKFESRVDSRYLPPGEYFLRAAVAQKEKELSGGDLGVFRFRVRPEAREFAYPKYQFDPQPLMPHYESGPFDVNVRLLKVVIRDREAERVLTLTRWAPFVRYTTWDGRDPQISENVIPVEKKERVDSFYIMPLDPPQNQVDFGGFVGDVGRDVDGDGRFDQLVITMKVYSRFEGPVFIQALVENQGTPIVYENYLTLGDNLLEYAVDKKYVLGLGQDGPFKFYDFQFFNRNPECSEDSCPKRIKPFFKVHLENYLTRPYPRNQFQ